MDWQTFLATSTGFELTGFMIIILIAVLILKGLALWHSARNKHTAWFVCLLIFNTLGILPLIYMFIHVWRKKKTTR